MRVCVCIIRDYDVRAASINALVQAIANNKLQRFSISGSEEIMPINCTLSPCIRSVHGRGRKMTRTQAEVHELGNRKPSLPVIISVDPVQICCYQIAT